MKMNEIWAPLWTAKTNWYLFRDDDLESLMLAPTHTVDTDLSLDPMEALGSSSYSLHTFITVLVIALFILVAYIVHILNKRNCPTRGIHSLIRDKKPRDTAKTNWYLFRDDDLESLMLAPTHTVDTDLSLDPMEALGSSSYSLHTFITVLVIALFILVAYIVHILNKRNCPTRIPIELISMDNSVLGDIDTESLKKARDQKPKYIKKADIKLQHRKKRKNAEIPKITETLRTEPNLRMAKSAEDDLSDGDTDLLLTKKVRKQPQEVSNDLFARFVKKKKK
ncbi:unnamed protein product [Orchesella dallaii]|uniref:Uncharacterized protein n=1 Tax=Orchesella dallaii TaxID=48710 RepID=A0ABP1R5Y8_9HEXA